MRCLDYVLTHMRHARWNASTMFRLVRGSLDKAPRLSGNLELARPWVGPLDPPYSPTLRQKSEHLMRLPTTAYHHGYSSNWRGSSVGVKSHFLLPIPGWEVKTCHYTHHTVHYFAIDHPRGRIRQGRKADMAQDSESFHCLVLYVTMVSRDGRPFPGHVAIATSIGIDKTSPQRHPRRPCLLLPYKRAGRGSMTGGGQQRTIDNKKPVSIPPKKINISSNLLCTLIFPLRPRLGSLFHSL
jgi:hypothetical protein